MIGTKKTPTRPYQSPTKTTPSFAHVFFLATGHGRSRCGRKKKDKPADPNPNPGQKGEKSPNQSDKAKSDIKNRKRRLACTVHCISQKKRQKSQNHDIGGRTYLTKQPANKCRRNNIQEISTIEGAFFIYYRQGVFFYVVRV